LDLMMSLTLGMKIFQKLLLPKNLLNKSWAMAERERW
jgi:hypothetical protein